LRACNCCISADAPYPGRLQCPANRNATACRCTKSNNTSNLTCDCENRFFFNLTARNVQQNNKSCACFSRGNATVQDCQCCTSETDLVPPRTTCAPQFSLAKCTQCANVTDPATRRASYQCNCTTSNSFNRNLVLVN